MNVTFKQLRAFHQVALSLSFTAAARQLHTTQSALSVAIMQLESTLDVKLFDRTTRRLALTNVGREFLPAITRILTDLDASISNLTALATVKRGTVILGCPPALAAALLARPISTFAIDHPHVKVVLKDSSSGQSIGKLKSGELEIAIGAMPDDQPDHELNALPFTNDRLVALVSNKSPLARKGTIPWHTLADYPIIAPAKDSSTRNLIEINFIKATGKQFIPVFEAAYWLTVASMVEAGMGVAVLPLHALKNLSLKSTRILHLTKPVVNRQIFVITHNERMLSPSARVFISHLLNYSKIISI